MASSNRQNNNTLQGRPLKPALASNRTAKTPITPRLAANPSAGIYTTSSSASNSNNHISSNSSSSISNATSHTFPRTTAPRLAPAAVTARSQQPSLQPSLIEDGSTPVRGLHADNITPRSSSRKSKLDSANTTPLTTDDTPTHVRPKLLSPSQSGPVPKRGSFEDSRPHLSTVKPKSVIVNGRDAVRGPPASRSPAYLAASTHHGPPKITKDTSPMFFRADQARPQPETQKRPPAKTAPSFFYASGQNGTGPARNPSPERPVLSRAKSPSLQLPPTSAGSASTSSPMVSPPLSAVSSRSYFPSPMVNSPSFQPPSPPKENIHLSYRKGVSQIIGRTAPSGAALILPDRPAAHLRKPHQRQLSLGSRVSFDGHIKRHSLSSIDTGSPEESHGSPGIDVKKLAAASSQEHHLQPDSEHHRPPNATEQRGLLAPLDENVQTTLNQVPDLAAEARRDRKVLDLEISNSSLLAINKSLEREIRKQKAELKRFRRLSRAGQFNVAAIDSGAPEHLLPLHEDDDDLPSVDVDVARPSSPFLSEPGEDYSDDEDDEDEDSTSSSAHPLSPIAQAAKDALHRADDEERLQQDLNKHRELLLDTERMNKSLQRCLTWTEDLIKHGQKALEYQVPSADVKLGGRILVDDDEVDEVSTQGGADTEDELPPPDDTIVHAMNGYLNARRGDGFRPPDVHRYSGSGTASGSEKDSGVEFGPLPQTPLRPSHTVEFGKPTPLRNPLLMSRDNPGNTHSVHLRPGDNNGHARGPSVGETF